MERCTSTLTFKYQKSSSKDWKIKKNEKPGPGNYLELEKAFSKTMYTSPTIKFKTDKRKSFVERAGENNKLYPAPNHYTFKDYKPEKIWRNISTKRH